MPVWLTWALKIVGAIIGAVTGTSSASDPTKAATDTGERLGKAEAGEANAVAGQKEVAGAVAAENAEATALSRDPGKLSDPSNPNSRAWKPGSAD